MERRHADPDRRAQHRALILEHVAAGDVGVDEAARILGLSSRQVGRLLARYADDPTTLAHRNRGRAPANRIAEATRAQLVDLARTRYAGVNHAHLAELLAEREGIIVAERTLRRILDEAGVAPVRTRRPPRHRTRRERMPREGLLLQVDGSRHDWMEGRGPWLTLVGGIDDATSRVTGATFRLAEDAAGYFAMFTQTAHRHGLPGAVYSDRHGIFVHEPARAPTLTEQLTGRRTFTQVGRALDDLEIGWIGARSPQAKGRVERLWGTLQSRLTSELRLAGATTIDHANAVLAAYLPRHNRRFAVPAEDPEPAWRRLPAGVSAESVFCFWYPRRVANDATLAWGGERLALPRARDGRSWAGRSVIVEERPDGSLWVSHAGERYRLAAAPPDPSVLRSRKLSREAAGKPDLPPAPPPRPARDGADDPTSARPRRPAPDHPWRR
ncbi:MAG: ISNCY family transposase [Chloroflexota bacterium]